MLISGRDKDDDGINAGAADESHEGEMGVLGTPGEKRWGDAVDTTSRGKRGVAASSNGVKPSGSFGNKGATLTLRDQEKVCIVLVPSRLSLSRKLTRVNKAHR